MAICALQVTSSVRLLPPPHPFFNKTRREPTLPMNLYERSPIAIVPGPLSAGFKNHWLSPPVAPIDVSAELARLRAERQKYEKLTSELERDQIPMLKAVLALRDADDLSKAGRRKTGRPRIWGCESDLQALRSLRKEHGRGKGDALFELGLTKNGKSKPTAHRRQMVAAAVLDAEKNDAADL
jgi:hypothetical protein